MSSPSSRPTRQHRQLLLAPAVLLALAATTGGCSTTSGDPDGSIPGALPRSPTTASSAEPAGVLPDRQLTSGAVASTDLATVCAPGYSESVRPPAAYTSALKRRQLAAGYPGTAGLTAADVEEDHLVMLALGGDPRSEANLWPEPRHIAAADGTDGGALAKDSYEAWLYDQVCHRRTISLLTAQHDLVTNWYAAWTAAGRPHSSGSNGTD